MPLNCHRTNANTGTKGLPGIGLKKYGPGVYSRANPESLPAILPTDASEPPTITFISKRMSPEQSASVASNHRHAIVLGSDFSDLWKPALLEPMDLFDKKNQMFLTSGCPPSSVHRHDDQQLSGGLRGQKLSAVGHGLHAKNEKCSIRCTQEH